MNYEIVNLEEKKVIGLIARTNNKSPEMGNIIGGLWTKFYEEGVYASIPTKKNGKALGIYTDYEGGAMDDYSIMVACEVTETKELPHSTVSKTIPAGRYAKFIVKGDMRTAVADCWMKIWSMDLPRTFACDFEEYQDDCMDENAEIHIYIGLK